MQKAILGKKLGMTQVFTEDGAVIPVTVVEAGPVTVTQLKTEENDGYTAVQVGFSDVEAKKLTKPVKGHLDKANVSGKKYFKEFRFDEGINYELGAEIKADVFAEGDKVDITGISKGKGYAGVIKRHNFHRLKETHGTGPVHRHPGSLGACSTPSRVMKNKKLAGHMGVEQVTVQNLDVVRVDVEKNILLIKGAVPGPKGGLLTIVNTVKA